jgi:hypothetical protein
MEFRKIVHDILSSMASFTLAMTGFRMTETGTS